MGWQGYDNEGCMPGDRERFLRLQQGMRRIDKPSPPSYTLAEIEQLARTYTTEAANRTTDELVLSLFLTWLAKREQGKGVNDG